MNPSKVTANEAPQRSGSALWQRLLLAGLLLGAALQTSRPLWNGDTFWHLASGHLYLELGELPALDPFTYTAGENVWVHHEWLAQIVLAVAERAVGLGGSRLFRAALTTLGLALLYFFARRRAGSSGAIIAVIFTCFGLLPNASLRPHLVAWPLVVVVLGALLPRLTASLAEKEATTRLRLGLLALFAMAMVLWVNMHSSALIAPLLIGAAAGGAILDAGLTRFGSARLGLVRPRSSGIESWRPAMRMAGLSGFAAVLCLLQPSGPDLFRYALETPDVNVRSQEWAPLLSTGTFNATPMTVIAWAVLAALVLAVGITERLGRGVRNARAWTSQTFSPGFPEFWASAACLVLALQHRRMAFFLFVPALYVAPPLARWLVQWSGQKEINPKILRLAKALAVALAASWALKGSPEALERQALREDYFPKTAADFLVSAEIEGRLFHDINWGGYLSYRRFPAQKIFADGRWLLTGPEAMADFPLLYFRGLPPSKTEALFDRYRVEVLVQPTRDVFHLPSVDGTRWRLAWTDPVATVLLRQGPSFDANRRRVCEIYRLFPSAAERARWPVEVQRPDGRASPTDVPTLLESAESRGGCGATPAAAHGSP